MVNMHGRLPNGATVLGLALALWLLALASSRVSGALWPQCGYPSCTGFAADAAPFLAQAARDMARAADLSAADAKANVRAGGDVNAGASAGANAAGMPGCLLALGIFTTAPDVALRDVHRAYLRRFRGVSFGACTGGQRTVFVRFVVGAPAPVSAALLREQAQHGDLLLLDTRENINDGKTLAYLSHVARSLPGGPHAPLFIGKADTDTFLHVDNLVKKLAALAARPFLTPFKYYGRDIGAATASERRAPTMSHHFMGAVYAMSLPIALRVALAVEAASQPGAVGTHAVLGLEDLVSSSFAERLALESGLGCEWQSDAEIYDHPDFPGGTSGPFRNTTVALHQLKTRERWESTLAYYFGREQRDLADATARAWR